jgi:hypothetical protein
MGGIRALKTYNRNQCPKLSWFYCLPQLQQLNASAGAIAASMTKLVNPGID